MSNHYHYYYKPPRRYGCFNLLLDLVLLTLTSGLWIIWIIIREIRARR